MISLPPFSRWRLLPAFPGTGSGIQNLPRVPSQFSDETYSKGKGQWRYRYREVDKHGQTIDFLLTEHRDTEAALRFLKKAIHRNRVPETITIEAFR